MGIGLLYYNKGLQQFERALYDAMETLKASGLVAAEFIVQERPVDYARAYHGQGHQSGLDAVIWIDTDLIIPPDAGQAGENVKCWYAHCGGHLSPGHAGQGPQFLLTRSYRR